MLSALRGPLLSLLKEPPVRRLVKPLLRALPFSVDVKSHWDAVERPEYLFGVLYAAEQAKRDGHAAVSVAEFGVAEGHGLLVLQQHALAVQEHTGIAVLVYGFDSGSGMPEGTGDYRDHPDVWKAGDYQMTEPLLRQQLRYGTTLRIGDVGVTAMTQPIAAPLGFMAMDLDLYSSTAAALRILLRADVAHLRRVALYFDDISAHYNHRFAGELLAIQEFNRTSKDVKIDRWHGIRAGRPFPDASWLEAMYLAHNLPAISATMLTRGPARMR